MFDRIYGLHARDVFVDVWANDWSERFEFRINGAVCAVLAYDEIRLDSQEPDFHIERYKAFLVCAFHARQEWILRLGPIYV